MAWETPIPAWNPEWYGFTDKGMEWLEQKGCSWVKVCAEPGDLLLWDSRTPHYNLSSVTDQSRFCVYTCYMPVAEVSQEDLIRKKAAFENWLGTTHWLVYQCSTMFSNGDWVANIFQAKLPGHREQQGQAKRGARSAQQIRTPQRSTIERACLQIDRHSLHQSRGVILVDHSYNLLPKLGGLDTIH